MRKCFPRRFLKGSRRTVLGDWCDDIVLDVGRSLPSIPEVNGEPWQIRKVWKDLIATICFARPSRKPTPPEGGLGRRHLHREMTRYRRRTPWREGVALKVKFWRRKHILRAWIRAELR